MGVSFCYLDEPEFSNTVINYAETFGQAHGWATRYVGNLLLKTKWPVEPGSYRPIGRAVAKITIATYYDPEVDLAVTMTWQNEAYKVVLWKHKCEAVEEAHSYEAHQLPAALDMITSMVCLNFNLSDTLSVGIEDIDLKPGWLKLDAKVVEKNKAYEDLGYGRFS